MKIHILLITATVILLSASQVQAVEYEVIILDTFGGEYSYAYAINDSGQVVGQSDTSDNQIRAFLWDKDNGMQNLGVLEISSNPGQPYYSCATGINNSGQVVGYSGYYDGPERAFLWENGQMYDLGSLGGTDSHATGINNQGQIVGYSKNSNGDICAFLWHNGIMQDIGTLEGRTTYAHGINDNGQVIGESYTSNGYNAFIWDNGIMNNLGTINQYGSVAKGINNSGQIAGSITPEKIYIRQEAVLWDNNSITALGYLDANDPRSYGQSINKHGQIVGFSLLRIGPSNPGHACLWENCEIFDLDIYFPENIHATYAYGINNYGQIVGYVEIIGGNGYRAFLMTPIPEPTTRLVPAEYPTIQSAIDTCNDGDEVVVAPGTYTGAGNYDIKFYGKAITVRSIEPENPSVVATTVIDCQRKGRGFIFINGEGPDSILSGLTITYGRGEKKIYGYGEGGQFPTRGGGAIFCYNSSPRIQNCVITRNIGGFQGRGGAIYSWGGSPLITNCTISENLTEWGGGGIWCRNSNIEIRNCDIRGNLEIDDWFGGGGIQCWEGHPTITHCSIINNTSMGEHQNGGGIYCRSPGALIEHCIITANTAIEGGGIYFYRSSPPLFNCKITSNNAERSGGGIYCLYSSPAIARCTFSDNLATSGGGAYFFGSTLSISNCIFWADTARSGSEMSLSTYSGGPPSQISVVYTNVQGGPVAVQVDPNCTLYWGEGSVDIDPCFVQPGYWDPNGTPEYLEDDFWVDGDYHLKSEGWRWDIKRNRWTYDDVTSRCIDAGNPGSPLGNELLSIPDDPNNIWGQNLRINMGAYGGTAKASMPPYDWAILGDLTNDGLVNFEDYAFQAANWLNSADQQPGDLNRDSLIDISDLALLVEDWLKQTTWHE